MDAPWGWQGRATAAGVAGRARGRPEARPRAGPLAPEQRLPEQQQHQQLRARRPAGEAGHAAPDGGLPHGPLRGRVRAPAAPAGVAGLRGAGPGARAPGAARAARPRHEATQENVPHKGPPDAPGARGGVVAAEKGENEELGDAAPVAGDGRTARVHVPPLARQEARPPCSAAIPPVTCPGFRDWQRLRGSAQAPPPRRAPACRHGVFAGTVLRRRPASGPASRHPLGVA
mmetsp:Transcript_95766/g.298240  ORF Transcript_95766/g.298240 Transcript_95766/m.298240 type:complete len:230 (+) Transcript_95766:477-1166(+)